MKFIAILCSLSALSSSLAFALPRAVSFNSGIEDDIDLGSNPIGIVGGDPVGSNTHYPWMASLQYVPIGPGKAFCGGSMIAPNAVLTAAHCTSKYDKPSRYGVTTRRYDQTKTSQAEGGIDFDVISWHIHPNYTNKNGGPNNDLAVWIVKPKKNWGSEPIVYAPFSKDPMAPVAPEKINVIGWGAIRESGPQSNVLLHTEIPTIDIPSCKTMYQNSKDAIVDSVICAGYPEGGKDTCQGDSGGPLFTLNSDGQPVVHGLTSWGEGCARKGKPGIYTRVGYYADWIQSILNSNLPIPTDQEPAELAGPVVLSPNNPEQPVEPAVTVPVQPLDPSNPNSPYFDPLDPYRGSY